MILAHHLILAAYGFWLPNDPRGSWSRFIGAWHLLRFGPATKLRTRCSRADQPCNAIQRRLAKHSLKYPPVRFTGLQARAIARGFADLAGRSSLTIHACAIMSDHVHLVVARHRFSIEAIASHLKGAATRRLNIEALHPLAAYACGEGRPPAPWARGAWRVYLDSDADVCRAIEYVENNPLRAGLRAQRWRFVCAYEGKRSPAGRG